MTRPWVKLFSDSLQEELQNDLAADSERSPDPITSRVGAFPLLATRQDISNTRMLASGVHTVHFGTHDQMEGTGLLEIYRDAATRSAAMGKLLNLSFRGWVPVGGNLVAGFVIDGPKSQQVLVRGVGSGLIRHGVKEALLDPWLRLVDQFGRVVAVSDDWSYDDDSGLIAQALDRTGSPALMTEGGRDAAMLLNLKPGAYTVVLESVQPMRSGVALLEVFNLDVIP